LQVILSQVLVDDVNTGFQSFQNLQVLRVDGVDVLNLRHLRELLRGARGRYIRVDMEDDRLVVLDREAAEESTARVQVRGRREGGGPRAVEVGVLRRGIPRTVARAAGRAAPFRTGHASTDQRANPLTPSPSHPQKARYRVPFLESADLANGEAEGRGDGKAGEMGAWGGPELASAASSEAAASTQAAAGGGGAGSDAGVEEEAGEGEEVGVEEEGEGEEEEARGRLPAVPAEPAPVIAAALPAEPDSPPRKRQKGARGGGGGSGGRGAGQRL
jgi:hypothetical protein